MNRFIRGGLYACILLLVFLLVAVIADFFFQGASSDDSLEVGPEPLRVLAPFDLPAHRRALQSAARAYSEQPGKPPVEITFLPQELYKKELSIQRNQNNLPDIVICENVIMPALIDMDVFRDITDYVDRQGIERHYYNPLLHNSRSDARYYGLPFTYDPYVLFYNQQAFSKGNIDVPRTWEEWVEASFQVQELGSYGCGIAARQPEDTAALFLHLLYSTGDSIREINGEGGLRVFALLEQLKLQKSISPDSINWGQLDLAEAFMDGQIMMMPANISVAVHLQQRALHFDVGVAPMPLDKKPVYLIHGKNIGVTSTADSVYAMDFFQYMTSAEVAGRIADDLNTIPVHLGAASHETERPLWLNEAELEMQNISQMSKGSFRTWFDISGSISQGVYDLLGESAPAGQVADAMQDRVRVAIIDQ